MLNQSQTQATPGNPALVSQEAVTRVADSIIRSFRAASSNSEPYKHWTLRNVLPQDALQQIADLPFKPIAEKNTAGTRESQNAFRNYFGHEECTQFEVADAVAQAFQSDAVISTIEEVCSVNLDNSFLRIEYAQDTDGFWLVPHTDIGVKLFTMLLYLSDDPSHANLGTDIYVDEKTHWGRSPFEPNLAMIFVPSNNTWHGFEPREIKGVRRSLIINYVKPEWRAREQLAFPHDPVKS